MRICEARGWFYNLGPRCIIGEPTATLLRAFGGIGASDGYVVP